MVCPVCSRGRSRSEGRRCGQHGWGQVLRRTHRRLLTRRCLRSQPHGHHFTQKCLKQRSEDRLKDLAGLFQHDGPDVAAVRGCLRKANQEDISKKQRDQALHLCMNYNASPVNGMLWGNIGVMKRTLESPSSTAEPAGDPLEPITLPGSLGGGDNRCAAELGMGGEGVLCVWEREALCLMF